MPNDFCLQTELFHSLHTTITNTVSFKKHSVFILWLKWKCRCSSNCLQMYNIYKPLSATAVCPCAMSYRQSHWPCCCFHAKFIKKESLNPQVPLVPQPPRIPVGKFNIAIRCRTAEPQGPTPVPISRLLWWQPLTPYGSPSLFSVHLVLQKKSLTSWDQQEGVGWPGLSWTTTQTDSSCVSMLLSLMNPVPL